ncbi:MAG: hypothetical protein LBR82_08195 [Desulfovibrio sp.]|jgi:hypothetical protein|nr:hypothetical protein [Desulfovibrio sp.]
MRMMFAVCFPALLILLLFPLPARSGEGAPAPVLRDDVAGYVLPLPAGWREVEDPGVLEALVRRVCVVFTSDGGISGATRIRGAVPADDAAAAPALVVFALGYAELGLDTGAVKEIAKDSQSLTATLANALQESYLRMFPQSIMVNSHLGDDFFSLNLRTVTDFADEAGTTRNRHLKVMLTVNGALVLMTVYNGLPDAAYDETLAASVRALRVLPEKILQSVNPPYRASLLDYLMLAGALVFFVYIFLRVRAAMRS